MSELDELINALKFVVGGLQDINKTLERGLGEKHELTRKGKCKNKRCKANLSL